MSERVICRYPVHDTTDEPSCPVCGGYNAMLHDSTFDRSDWEMVKNIDFRKCRDCGVLAVRVD